MLGRAPQTKETLPDFVKIWIPINGTQQCGIRSPEIHRNSTGFTGCQRDLRIWGVTRTPPAGEKGDLIQKCYKLGCHKKKLLQNDKDDP